MPFEMSLFAAVEAAVDSAVRNMSPDEAQNFQRGVCIILEPIVRQVESTSSVSDDKGFVTMI
jgi:hypothetical protein